MDQDSAVVAVKRCLGLFWSGTVWRAAITYVIPGTAELAFPAYPFCSYHAIRVNLFGMGSSFLYSPLAVFSQIFITHIVSPLDIPSVRLGANPQGLIQRFPPTIYLETNNPLSMDGLLSGVLSKFGGSGWESNPPKTLLMPHDAFEVREAHRDSTAPLPR